MTRRTPTGRLGECSSSSKPRNLSTKNLRPSPERKFTCSSQAGFLVWSGCVFRRQRLPRLDRPTRPEESGDVMRVPPPLVAVAAALAQRALTGATAKPTASRAGLATAVGVASMSLAGAAASQFRRRGTTVDPIHPDQVSVLVTTGPNSISRNPMYVGMAGLLTANAVLERLLGRSRPRGGFRRTHRQVPDRCGGIGAAREVRNRVRVLSRRIATMDRPALWTTRSHKAQRPSSLTSSKRRSGASPRIRTACRLSPARG